MRKAAGGLVVKEAYPGGREGRCTRDRMTGLCWGTAVETESADAGCISNSLVWNLTSIVKARNTGYL